MINSYELFVILLLYYIYNNIIESIKEYLSLDNQYHKKILKKSSF